MKQVILFTIILFVSLGVTTEASSGGQTSLWSDSIVEVREALVTQGLATNETVVCGALAIKAYADATAQGIGTSVVVHQANKQAFGDALMGIFIRKNNLPCASTESTLTWEQVEAHRVQHFGFIPFAEKDILTAKRQAESIVARMAPAAATVVTEASPVEKTQSEPVEVQSASQVQKSDAIEAIVEAETPVATSQSVSPPTTSRRLVPVTTVNTGELVDVINVGRKPLPNQSQMEDFLFERAEAERKAADEAAKKEAEAQAPETTETVTQGDSQEQAETAEETRPWWIPQYQWDMERRKRERPRHRPRHVDSSRYHAEEFIRRYFHDMPIMVTVASCESTFDNVQSRERYQKGDRRGQQERSFGFFQIHELAWHDDALALGLSDYQTDPIQNLQMARHVYETQGLQAWEGTQHCWGSMARSLGLR